MVSWTGLKLADEVMEIPDEPAFPAGELSISNVSGAASAQSIAGEGDIKGEEEKKPTPTPSEATDEEPCEKAGAVPTDYVSINRVLKLHQDVPPRICKVFGGILDKPITYTEATSSNEKNKLTG